MRAIERAEREQAQPRTFRTATVYAIFVGWTLFSVFVYSHFSQLGDANSYLSGAYEETGEART